MAELFMQIWDFLMLPITVLDFTFRPAYFILFSAGVPIFHMILDFYNPRDKIE